MAITRRTPQTPGAKKDTPTTQATTDTELQKADESEQVAPTVEELRSQLAAAQAEIKALKKQKPEKTNAAIEESKGRIVLTTNGWTKEY